MRKSLIALALFVGAAAMWTTLAMADGTRSVDEGIKLWDPQTTQMNLSRAARLGTAQITDTFFIGHRNSSPYSAPFFVGVGRGRPASGPSVPDPFEGVWDFDRFNGGALDSMQGWVPVVSPNTRTAGTIPDVQRSWNCLDWGNRLNVEPRYLGTNAGNGRTIGIVSAWHVDRGAGVPNPVTLNASPWWTPLAGEASAWCGLRAGGDNTYVDALGLGGTGVAINGETLVGMVRAVGGAPGTDKLFPGYAGQWDQMLYRDVRVADAAACTVSFKYLAKMSTGTNSAETTCKGWFDKDPLSLTAGNFISASAHPGPRLGPVDSFMVYVGVPTDPEACRYTDSSEPRPIYDLKRRWFSEVISINKPYTEILSVAGADSAYKAAPLVVALDNSVIQPMLDAQAGSGGIIRVVFRSKTNANFSDETGTGGSYNSATEGAVRIDDVSITGCAVPVSSGFETNQEIDNTIEPDNSDLPGPAVGMGYALAAWHATGKGPKHMVHTHPLLGGDIGGGNYYSPLAWADICGAVGASTRFCNIDGVVISTGDHDLGEAAGGGPNTPFRENRSGMLSPTMNWVTPDPGYNDIGLDRSHATSTADWFFQMDNYWGVFNTSFDGSVLGSAPMCWPATQANGAQIWSDVYLTGVWTNSNKICSQFSDTFKALLMTTNPTGIPDSLKIWIFREQRCISWGITSTCSPTYGHYIDNISVVIPPTKGAADVLAVDIWDWYNDAFPANETAGLPAVPAAFDTCGAHIMIARNIAATTGNAQRFCVPGDSIYIASQYPPGTEMRLDCVFRVDPGPGNYVTLGTRSSGLRQRPDLTTPVTVGDGSFWGQYLSNNGLFGSPGGHAGGVWDRDVWNSARLDTVETNYFPVNRRTGNLSNLSVGNWQSTLHDAEPKFGTLGILKNRCFLIDTALAAPLNSTNTTCSSEPAWLTTLPQWYTGYDGSQQTREYTKVFPDGLLAPGAQIQYFLRLSRLVSPGTFVMIPDTNRITPQPKGSAWDTDGARWEKIAILPDRWKDVTYNGIGSACMLVFDVQDRRGAERGWQSAADSIGATQVAKWGAQNGWHCDGGYVASDASNNYTNETDLGPKGQYAATNPMGPSPVGAGSAISVWRHGGQAGTTWDIYNVKASESSTTGAAQIGDRLAYRANMGLLTGKEGRHGPTPEMLRTFYRMLFFLNGNLNNRFFGRVNDRTNDDIGLTIDFLTFGASQGNPRGLWAIGNGWVEGINGCCTVGGGATGTAFLNTNLATVLRSASYLALSGISSSTYPYIDLIPTSVITTGGQVYMVSNSCGLTNDVVTVNAAVPGATVASYYQNLGAAGPYISGVYAPSTTGHPYVTLVNGWNTNNMLSAPGAQNTRGRLLYIQQVLVNVFGSICPFAATPIVDVPQNTARTVNFLGNLWGNPMVAGGTATVHFGLAKADRVEVKVYDVTGRLVRSLADRNFQSGEHTLVWDGTNDQGSVVSRGVYFTQVKFVNSGFVSAKKLTVLK